MLVGGLAEIKPVVLSVTGLTALNKTYDATTAATLSGTATATITPLGSDDVRLNLGGSGAAVFSTMNVGTNIHVTLTSNALAGTDAGNYTILPNQLSATIHPKNISLSGTPVAASRVYDGTDITSISGVAVNGLIAGDAASLAGIFNSPDVGERKSP